MPDFGNDIRHRVDGNLFNLYVKVNHNINFLCSFCAKRVNRERDLITLCKEFWWIQQYIQSTSALWIHSAIFWASIQFVIHSVQHRLIIRTMIADENKSAAPAKIFSPTLLPQVHKPDQWQNFANAPTMLLGWRTSAPWRGSQQLNLATKGRLNGYIYHFLFVQFNASNVINIWICVAWVISPENKSTIRFENKCNLYATLYFWFWLPLSSVDCA